MVIRVFDRNVVSLKSTSFLSHNFIFSFVLFILYFGCVSFAVASESSCPSLIWSWPVDFGQHYPHLFWDIWTNHLKTIQQSLVEFRTGAIMQNQYPNYITTWIQPNIHLPINFHSLAVFIHQFLMNVEFFNLVLIYV